MIAIYLNSGEWGGVDVLVGRYSEYLSEQQIDFIVIDKENSRFRCENPNVKCIEISELKVYASRIKHVLLPSSSKLRDVVIFPDMYDANVFIWVVHPNDVFRAYFPYSGKALDTIGYTAVRLLRQIFRSHAKIYDDYFKCLVEAGAIAVMDGATLRSFQYFLPNLNLKPHMIPIPTSIDSIPRIHKKMFEPGKLSIGYLGRLDSFKWSAVHPFIDTTLRQISSQMDVTLHVVSEGTYIDCLRKACNHSGIRLVEHGFLQNTKAKETLFKNADLCIAMGTSALDLASQGIPVVIVDPSLKKYCIPQQTFNYVHYIDDATVGEFRDFPGYVKGKWSFDEILKMLPNPSISDDSIYYIRNTHDKNEIFKDLTEKMSFSKIKCNNLNQITSVLLGSFTKSKRSVFSSLFWRQK